jgi:transcriptional regulator with GAF, ATPase, and Fis domain
VVAGAVLAVLWIALVIPLQLRSGATDVPRQWIQTSFVLLGLFPIGLVMLCGYLIIELKKLLSRGLRGYSSPLDQRFYDLLLSVRRVNRTMGRENNVQAVLDDITQACIEAFDCQQVSLMLVDEAGKELQVRSAAGVLKEAILGRTQPVGSGIAGKAAEEWKPLLLGETIDPQKFRDVQKKTLPIISAMVVPVILRQDLVGILNITSRREGHTYTKEDLDAAMVFAEIVAVTIRHAQQTQWMRETIQRLSGGDDQGTRPVDRAA